MKPTGRPAVAVTVTLAVIGLAGCVSLPASGRVSAAQSPGFNGSAPVISVPRPPGTNWTPIEIVTGFLAASGSLLSGGSRAVARDYLAQGYRRKWQPDLLSPTVIDSSLADLRITQPSVGTAAGLSNYASVVVKSSSVETLQPAGNTHAGNIVVSAPFKFQFSLIKNSKSQWRIGQLPGGKYFFLLTQPDFLRDYQPRDLYFFAATNPKVLVPYPDFIPAQAQTQAGAQELANDLLRSVPEGSDGAGPPGWLNEAVTTAFPPGSKISSVNVSGVKATVNLDLPAPVSISDWSIAEMEAQLVWTLTNAPYGGGISGIGSVQLVVHDGPDKLVFPQQFSGYVPPVGSGSLYFQVTGTSGRPVIMTDDGRSESPIRVLTSVAFGGGAFTDIAVLPGKPRQPREPPELGACRGDDVYLAPLRHRPHVTKQVLPTRCTSLSWDGNGNLWVTSGATLYLLRTVSPSPEKVSSSLGLPAPHTVSSFQVAPDGVRAAMIVRSKKGSKVVVAAISPNSDLPPSTPTVPGAAVYYLAQSGTQVQVGSDIADPVALAWQNPDDLLVLGSSAGQRYVFQVPLNGEPSVRSSFAVPADAQWLTADGQGVVVGPLLAAGAIWRSRTWNGTWSRVTSTGRTPVYPG